ncbi:PASTA domain-containing protein [Kribbella antibiotica]|uniref:PASTA domain-containing protein n=1 Tax=Kribbella antibiotica TaxID=190195 RepID=A0A4R4ZQW0_9ACTN|nr:PASTA domain-containing protein [Kribbella antibiotica]TDD60434.1 PASTA domain-containing protein [Kribbella antibiotica]
MTDPALNDVLDRAVAGKAVGPPRIDAIRSGAARRRRRRTTGVVGAAAVAVLAVVGGTAVFAPGDRAPVAVNPPVVSNPPVVPTRLVGVGHVAVAVPVGWAQNATYCFTPQRDTVIVNQGPEGYCMARRPEGVESIEILRGKSTRFPFRDGKIVEIGGARAERLPTVCVASDSDRPTECSATVYFPTLDVTVHLESTTGAAEVDRMIGWIVVVPDQVGVPEYATPVTKYTAELTALGLRPVVVTKKIPRYQDGDILDVVPAPGVLVAPGATVTITVVDNS